MRKRAFTLVELLVVIVVLTILAALLFPVFARSKTEAKVTDARARLRGFHRATLLYANDWGTAPIVIAAEKDRPHGDDTPTMAANRRWAPLITDAYVTLGVPKDQWIIPGSRFTEQDFRMSFAFPYNPFLQGVPFEFFERENPCPLFEEIPRVWRRERAGGPRLVIWADSAVKSMPESYNGLNEKACYDPSEFAPGDK